MKRKKVESKPCRNCGVGPEWHNTSPYDDLLCEFERLPIQIQEAFNNSQDENMQPYVIYYPMDNLQMLEYEYEKTLNEAPTRKSLR